MLRPDERGHEDGAVEHALGDGAELLGLDDDAVDELVGGRRERGDPERGAGAGEVVRVDLGGRAAGEEDEVVAVEGGELLPATEADDGEVGPWAVRRGGVLPREGEVGCGHGVCSCTG